MYRIPRNRYKSSLCYCCHQLKYSEINKLHMHLELNDIMNNQPSTRCCPNIKPAMMLQTKNNNDNIGTCVIIITVVGVMNRRLFAY